MNVKELKKLLELLPDKMEVILQEDAEGNGYSPLEGGDSNAVYIPKGRRQGDVYWVKWSADGNCVADACDENIREEIKVKPRSLVLYP